MHLKHMVFLFPEIFKQRAVEENSTKAFGGCKTPAIRIMAAKKAALR